LLDTIPNGHVFAMSVTMYITNHVSYAAHKYVTLPHITFHIAYRQQVEGKQILRKAVVLSFYTCKSRVLTKYAYFLLLLRQIISEPQTPRGQDLL